MTGGSNVYNSQRKRPSPVAWEREASGVELLGTERGEDVADWRAGQGPDHGCGSELTVPSGHTMCTGFPCRLAYRTVAQVPDRSVSAISFGVAISAAVASTMARLRSR